MNEELVELGDVDFCKLIALRKLMSLIQQTRVVRGWYVLLCESILRCNPILDGL